MAARLNRRHQDFVRDKIQASQLINVLQNHALGVGTELSASRIKAIEVLLRKTLPDLSQVALTDPEGGELGVVHKIELVAMEEPEMDGDA